MRLKNMKIEDLELLSYTDLTYKILKENKKTMNTKIIFKEICDLLGYTDEDFTEKIGDYYTSLTIDKRFVMLENGEWDIRDNRKVEINLEDEIEEDEDEIEEDEEDEELEEETEEKEESNVDAVLEDDDLDDSDDDMEELSIVDEEEVE